MVYSAQNIHEISCKNTIDDHSKKGLKALPTTLGGNVLQGNNSVQNETRHILKI
jgi:hypothetical protein